jgi:dienelactone hydrolase
MRDVARWKAIPASPASGEGRTDAYGMRAMLPAFHERRVARMDFPWSWPVDGMDFGAWRAQARALYVETLSVPPPRAAFDPQVLAVEDRGSYEARKLAFNLSADNRVLAYLLVPKGAGPFPAMLALHDHGAHFSIGKEKVVRPFGVPDAVLQDAEEWVKTCYGGRYIGDELAQRGYVVFATDALFWGDRGRFEGVEYEAQQALAANVLQLGQSWAGMIVWDDIRSAEFVQGLPEVAPDRIGFVGLSMGSNRSWHLAAATDIVQAGIAICWMGDTPTLAAEGNNQTKGYSAFSMIHPGLRNALDYADVASIACPKPMLFYNGEQDGLFPVVGVEAAYKKLHEVWASQNAEDRLETRLWPVPHEFNAEMQQAAFDWIDQFLK